MAEQKVFSDESHQHEKSPAQLRIDILSSQKNAIRNRRLSNPHFTTQEAELGMYVEEIEPQVRSAVFSLNRKGYDTFSSGFYDFDPRYQMIEGKFHIDEHTATLLELNGITVMEGYIHDLKEQDPITILQFMPDTTDIDEITTFWNHIANIIPDKNNGVIV